MSRATGLLLRLCVYFIKFIGIIKAEADGIDLKA